MLSSAHRFIFLHVPKTAGNAVQSYLLPFSDDRKVTSRFQDGVERFGVEGAVTPAKHALLADYARRLGPALTQFKVILPVRDPLDRALSMYFSPHRLYGRPEGHVLRYAPAEFDAVLRGMPSIADHLRVEGAIRPPDFVLRHAHLAEDLDVVANAFGLPPVVLPVLNRSLDQHGVREMLKQDAEVVAKVRARFAEDYALFDF